ncbi:MAG: outer membrane protein assembly factor BamB [Planctomycetota bacterium]|jgi:outer membrane protein assembly factor BamB
MTMTIKRYFAGAIAIICAANIAASSAYAQWTQFGGPQRNFHAPAEELAESWPLGGPPVIWRRPLGDGYSGVLVDGDRLYTMYRRGGDEVIVAMARESGLTVWEHIYAVTTTDSADDYGGGPSATPAIAGDFLVTVGIGIDIHCLNKETGEVIWSRDIMEEFEMPMPGRGFSASPVIIEDRNLVILPIGGNSEVLAVNDVRNVGVPDGAVAAFDLETGWIVWATQDFPGSKASPLLIEFDGRQQVVVFMGNELAGLNPSDGTLLWRHQHSTDYAFNCSSPVFDGKDTIFCSSAYSNCTEAVQLIATDNGIEAKAKWSSRRLRIHFTNMLLVKGRLYGVNGMGRPGMLTSIDAATGEMLWRSRGFARANLVYADGKFLILDEDGQLALATFGEDGPKTHGKLNVSDSHAFAAPTLVGQSLYLRDRKFLTAFDISPVAVAEFAKGRGRAFAAEIPELPTGVAALLGEFVTESTGNEPQQVQVLIQQGWLMLELPEQGRVRLAPQSDSSRWEFVEDRTSGSDPRTIEFYRDAKGTVAELVLRSARQASRTYRLVFVP